MPNPVVHWEIPAREPKKLQDFYAHLFDWHIDAGNPMSYGFVDTHAERGINGGIPAAEEGGSSVSIVVEVEDLQAYLDKAQALGGRMVLPPTEIPGVVTFARFADPEGNIIGLVKAE